MSRDEIAQKLTAIQADVRMILAHLGISGENVAQDGSEEASGVDMERLHRDWKKKVNEAWERHLQERGASMGLDDPDVVTPEDETEFQGGWLR